MTIPPIPTNETQRACDIKEGKVDDDKFEPQTHEQINNKLEFNRRS